MERQLFKTTTTFLREAFSQLSVSSEFIFLSPWVPGSFLDRLVSVSCWIRRMISQFPVTGSMSKCALTAPVSVFNLYNSEDVLNRRNDEEKLEPELNFKCFCRRSEYLRKSNPTIW